MNGGDTNLGGPQVAPNSPTPPTPGSQPASSASSISSDSSPIISIPHPDKAPSKPLVIKVQTPTPQPSTPPSTPSSTPSPSLSSSTPAAPAPRAPTPTIATSPQPSTPTLARPATISTETFSTPASSTTGAYYGTNASMPAQNYPSGYTNSATSPTMQTYASQYPTSTDTYAQDDQEFIELAGSTPQPKKSKKWWVIGSIVAGMLFVCVILFIILSTQNNNINYNLQNSFNRYANYFLYGEDKTDGAWIKDDGSESPYFVDQTKATEINTDYFNEAKNLFDAFKTIATDDSEENVISTEVLDEYSTILDLVVNYYTQGITSRSDILQAYIEGGEKKAREYIIDKIQIYKGIKELHDLNYYDLSMSLGEKNLYMITLYEQEGCLVNKEIDYACASQHYNDSMKKTSQEISELTDYVDMLISHSEDDLYEYLFAIETIINENNSGDT